MRIWMDDQREPTPGFDRVCRTAEEALELLRACARGEVPVEEISLDFNMGSGANGLTVAQWIRSEAEAGRLPPFSCYAHTDHPLAREEMELELLAADRAWRRSQGKS